MSVKTFGNALLFLAFIVAVMGIVQPSAPISTIVAAFLFAGFAIVTTQAHHDWSDGYTAGRYDSTVERLDLEAKERELDEYEPPRRGEILYKCGLKGCSCVEDSRFKRWSE